MINTLTIALAQMNVMVGDVQTNCAKILDWAKTAQEQHQADLVVFPELAITGYPPEDLLLREEFLDQVDQHLLKIQSQTEEIAILVGHPCRQDGRLFNSASLFRHGQRVATYHKQLLPNYNVFDEKRYFSPADQPCVIALNGIALGVTICEDIWQPGPAKLAAQAGAQLLVNLNASPFHIDKQQEREVAVKLRAQENRLPVLYLNMVGGQDELVFDGCSFVMAPNGELLQRAPAFSEELLIQKVKQGDNLELELQSGPVTRKNSLPQNVYAALVLGVRDYVNKNRFKGAIIGLSGGIDSALTLTIAVDALGPDRVEAVMMPSPYTADISLEDARAEAELLGIHYSEIMISPIVDQVEKQLEPHFTGLARDLTEENIQARTRGLLLMALSNKTGMLVLTTGNKSEMAVGYATLYGDMAGGFAAIKDIPKMLVYQLAEYRNSIKQVIPERVLTRAPSAELRDNQKDEDSLPPYPVLDRILELYIEQDRSVSDIIKVLHYDPDAIREVVRLINRNEYKRRQAAPGVRITQRAFGKDRRYPITSGFRELPS